MTFYLFFFFYRTHLFLSSADSFVTLVIHISFLVTSCTSSLALPGSSIFQHPTPRMSEPSLSRLPHVVSEPSNLDCLSACAPSLYPEPPLWCFSPILAWQLLFHHPLHDIPSSILPSDIPFCILPLFYYYTFFLFPLYLLFYPFFILSIFPSSVVTCHFNSPYRRKFKEVNDLFPASLHSPLNQQAFTNYACTLFQRLCLLLHYPASAMRHRNSNQSGLIAL